MKIEPFLQSGELALGVAAPRDLDHALSVASRTYITSRYFWETSSNDQFVLVDFPDFLHPVVQRIAEAATGSE